MTSASVPAHLQQPQGPPRLHGPPLPLPGPGVPSSPGVRYQVLPEVKGPPSSVLVQCAVSSGLLAKRSWSTQAAMSPQYVWGERNPQGRSESSHQLPALWMRSATLPLKSGTSGAM